MSSREQLYLPNEERFGTLSTGFYGFFEKLGTMRKFHSFVADTIISRNPETVLDIGFGTGAVIERICGTGSGGDLFGVEPSPAMLRKAQSRAKKCPGNRPVTLALGSSRSIPFDRKFNVIYSSLSFHHWADQEDSLLNVMKHLDSDGAFLAFEFGTELLKGYRKMASSHSVSLEALKKFSNIARVHVEDHGEYRVIEFRPPAP